MERKGDKITILKRDLHSRVHSRVVHKTENTKLANKEACMVSQKWNFKKLNLQNQTERWVPGTGVGRRMGGCQST